MKGKNKKLLDAYARLLLAGVIARIYTDLFCRASLVPDPPRYARQLKIARAKIACMDFGAEFRNALSLAQENPEKI